MTRQPIDSAGDRLGPQRLAKNMAVLLRAVKECSAAAQRYEERPTFVCSMTTPVGGFGVIESM